MGLRYMSVSAPNPSYTGGLTAGFARESAMLNVLRPLLAIAFLVTSGLASADQQVSHFAAAVQAKLSRLSTFAAASDGTTDEATSEQTVFVDVTSDGLVIRVQDQSPIVDSSAAKFQRLILVASPFPKLPAVLSSDYSIVRLAIVYLAAPGKNPSVRRVEVKGGCRYIEFKDAL